MGFALYQIQVEGYLSVHSNHDLDDAYGRTVATDAAIFPPALRAYGFFGRRPSIVTTVKARGFRYLLDASIISLFVIELMVS